MQEPLQLLPVAEYKTLYNILKSHAPFALFAQYFILNLIKWNENEQKQSTFENMMEKLKVYVPKSGFTKNATFICLDYVGKFTAYYVQIFTLEQSCDELENCLRHTKVIDWPQNPYFGAVHVAHQRVFRQIIDEKGFRIVFDPPCTYFWITRANIEDYGEINFPLDIVADQLQLSDANVVDANWPYSSEYSLKSIQLLIELNFCCCLRKAGKLIAWLTTNEHFALGMLHVVESERGNGYAQLLVKYYCKTFLKIENLLPITFIENDNEKSIKLFKKLSFSEIDGLAWIAIEKRN